jgi:hypothetical protein
LIWNCRQVPDHAPFVVQRSVYRPVPELYDIEPLAAALAPTGVTVAYRRQGSRPIGGAAPGPENGRS